MQYLQYELQPAFVPSSDPHVHRKFKVRCVSYDGVGFTAEKPEGETFSIFYFLSNPTGTLVKTNLQHSRKVQNGYPQSNLNADGSFGVLGVAKLR